MPKSLRFYTEKDVPCEPSYHTFANILEDGTRINGTAITFYEVVLDSCLKSEVVTLGGSGLQDQGENDPVTYPACEGNHSHDK